MNIYWLIAGLLASIAAVAHMVVGTRETLTTRISPEHTRPYQNWVQAYGAWHLVSVDLLGLAAVLFWMAFTPLHPAHNLVSQGIIFWMGGWTVAWIVSVGLSADNTLVYRKLLQWILFVIIGMLVYGGR